jgi:hypothetical protein
MGNNRWAIMNEKSVSGRIGGVKYERNLRPVVDSNKIR